MKYHIIKRTKPKKPTKRKKVGPDGKIRVAKYKRNINGKIFKVGGYRKKVGPSKKVTVKTKDVGIMQLGFDDQGKITGSKIKKFEPKTKLSQSIRKLPMNKKIDFFEGRISNEDLFRYNVP